MTATTCGFSTQFDTILTLNQGNRPYTACADDMVFSVDCETQSWLGFDSLRRLTSGSGIRALVIDGFRPGDSGLFEVSAFFP